jgi:hypothetical protein
MNISILLCDSLCVCVCVCVCERERERERERSLAYICGMNDKIVNTCVKSNDNG